MINDQTVIRFDKKWKMVSLIILNFITYVQWFKNIKCNELFESKYTIYISLIVYDDENSFCISYRYALKEDLNT